MKTRLMVALALCVLMLPLLNACAAGQEADVPSPSSRAAAAIGAAHTAYAARATAAKATGQPPAAAASGAQPLWQELIDRAKTLKSSAVQRPDAQAQPFWDAVLSRIRQMKSSGADREDALSLPSIWRSVYDEYRSALASRHPGGLRPLTPQ
ncbi:MAG TPA: hypothetical protein VD886_00865 [Herpetosiphonaceae bacterium]|nr:hypothetical protein [Herpetosiphonaceae bacterium]